MPLKLDRFGEHDSVKTYARFQKYFSSYTETVISAA